MPAHEENMLLMGYLDGELSPDEEKRIEKHLTECKECTEELERYKKLNDIVQPMDFVTLEDKLMENYWSKGYRKIERNLAVFFLFASLSILTGFGIMQIVIKIWNSAVIPLPIKFSIFAVLTGGTALLLSILREKLFLRKKQRYSDIRR